MGERTRRTGWAALQAPPRAPGGPRGAALPGAPAPAPAGITHQVLYAPHGGGVSPLEEGREEGGVRAGRGPGGPRTVRRAPRLAVGGCRAEGTESCPQPAHGQEARKGSVPPCPSGRATPTAVHPGTQGRLLGALGVAARPWGTSARFLTPPPSAHSPARREARPDRTKSPGRTPRGDCAGAGGSPAPEDGAAPRLQQGGGALSSWPHTPAEVPLFKGASPLASRSPTPGPPTCCSWLPAPCPHRPPFIQLRGRSYI